MLPTSGAQFPDHADFPTWENQGLQESEALMDCRVVHCKRAPYDVYIGRPGPWGNPFRIGVDGSRSQVIAKYREWLKSHPEVVERARRELAGKILGCWCAPNPCHGEVLAEIANQPEGGA